MVGRDEGGTETDKNIKSRKIFWWWVCRQSAVRPVVIVISIRTYWRPWQSWSRCPRGRGCLRRWRGRCTAPRPTWRPPPAPADSRTQARRRNSEKNVSDKLYRKLIKHKPNWTQGKISPEIWRKWTDLSWRPQIRRWGTAMGCQLTRHKTHHIWFEVWRDDRWLDLPWCWLRESSPTRRCRQPRHSGLRCSWRSLAPRETILCWNLFMSNDFGKCRMFYLPKLPEHFLFFKNIRCWILHLECKREWDFSAIVWSL